MFLNFTSDRALTSHKNLPHRPNMKIGENGVTFIGVGMGTWLPDSVPILTSSQAPQRNPLDAVEQSLDFMSTGLMQPCPHSTGQETEFHTVT